MVYSTLRVIYNCLPFVILTGQVIPMIDALLLDLQFFWARVWSLGVQRSKQLFLAQALRLSISLLLLLLQHYFGCACCSRNFKSHFLQFLSYGVIMSVHLLWCLTLYSMPEQNTLKLIIILFEKRCLIVIFQSSLFPLLIKFQTFLQRHYPLLVLHISLPSSWWFLLPLACRGLLG